jgi:hypothetical protein
VGRPHVASWAETEIPLVADLGDGTDDPRATAPDLLRRALAALPPRARAGRVGLRADAGYFAALERRNNSVHRSQGVDPGTSHILRSGFTSFQTTDI